MAETSYSEILLLDRIYGFLCLALGLFVIYAIVNEIQLFRTRQTLARIRQLLETLLEDQRRGGGRKPEQ